MTVKERILSIRLLEKAEKQVAFAAALGLSWTVPPVSAPEQQPSTASEYLQFFDDLKGERVWSM